MIGVTSPEVMECNVNVSVDIGLHFKQTRKKMTDSQMEDWFIQRRDSCRDSSLAAIYDRCRAIIKWARTCQCTKITLWETQKEISFKIFFDDWDYLHDFLKDYDDCVEGACM